MGRPARTLVLVAALVLPAADQAHAVDRFVDEDGTGAGGCTSMTNPCPTITAGISAAGVGDTVFVGGGAYSGTVSLGSGKSLIASNFNPALTSDGPTVIDGGGSKAVSVPAMSPGGTIQGFTLRSTMGGVQLLSAATLRQNRVESGGGFAVSTGADGAVIDDNTIVDPGADGDQQALEMGGSGEVTDNTIMGFRVGISGLGTQILRNTLSGMHEGGGGNPIGISIDSDALVADNVLGPATGTNAWGVAIDGTNTDATLERNRVTGWEYGVKTAATNSVSMNGDMVINGSFRGLDMFDNGMLGKGNINALNITVAGYPTQVHANGTDLVLGSSIIGNGSTGGNAITTANGGDCTITDSRGPAALASPTPNCRNFAFTDDPGFVNLALGDGHLQPGSAMIDRIAATPNTVPDLDGDARPTRGKDSDNTCAATSDVGADEFSPLPAFCAEPETTLTAGPTGTTSDTTPTFEFSSSKLPSTFQCSVDSGAFGACVSPVTTAALGSGAHSFSVRAIEKHGVVDSTPAVRSFSIGQAAMGSGGGGGGGSSGQGGSAGPGAVTIAGGRLLMSRAGVVTVTLGCGKVACSGRLALATLRRVRLSRRARVRLGSKRYSIRAGRRGKVRIRLPRRNRALVRRLRRVRVRITASPAGGRAIRRTATLRARRR